MADGRGAGPAVLRALDFAGVDAETPAFTVVVRSDVAAEEVDLTPGVIRGTDSFGLGAARATVWRSGCAATAFAVDEVSSALASAGFSEATADAAAGRTIPSA